MYTFYTPEARNLTPSLHFAHPCRQRQAFQTPSAELYPSDRLDPIPQPCLTSSTSTLPTPTSSPVTVLPPANITPPQQGGYPPQGYPPQQGYGGPPPQGGMQYQQPQPQPQQKSSDKGCLGACLATLCCCFVCEEGCECCADCIECCEMC
ncbi:uncharacterized protein N7473_012434 [Penicillium subrubescens]|uniref:uncharacterized protein n=1 Tax=Penicillium subrubescens TaxID=1316194 RepID=UPI002545A7FC|nr:uncharacterized protein N7473_012434 [Penicillium subrubescens]KAJ5875087.1 hypothetical protein N7473_012434 [Penicillium subrubescens]